MSVLKVDRSTAGEGAEDCLVLVQISHYEGTGKGMALFSIPGAIFLMYYILIVPKHIIFCRLEHRQKDMGHLVPRR
jgi:hypothetical protein